MNDEKAQCQKECLSRSLRYHRELEYLLYESDVLEETDPTTRTEDLAEAVAIFLTYKSGFLLVRGSFGNGEFRIGPSAFSRRDFSSQAIAPVVSFIFESALKDLANHLYQERYPGEKIFV